MIVAVISQGTGENRVSSTCDSWLYKSAFLRNREVKNEKLDF